MTFDGSSRRAEPPPPTTAPDRWIDRLGAKRRLVVALAIAIAAYVSR